VVRAVCGEKHSMERKSLRGCVPLAPPWLGKMMTTNTIGSHDTVIILIELLLYFDKRATIFLKSGIPLISRPLALKDTS